MKLNVAKSILFKKNKKFIIFIFLLSFLIRLVFFCFFLSKDKNYWNYDSVLYNNVALQIAQNNKICEQSGNYSFHRVPGYSIYLSIFYKIFGENSHENIKKALLAQVFIASFIPVLIFLLSLTLFPENILLAKISALFSIFHLGYVLFSGLCMTESLFIFFLLLFFIFYFCEKFLLSGIFLGIASLIRPVGIYLIILSIILILIFSKKNLKNKIKSILILFLSWVLIVSFWLIRNYNLTGYVFFHTLPGIHFLKHSAGRIASEIYKTDYMSGLRIVTNDLDNLVKKKEILLNKKLSDIETCNLAEKVSLDYFKKDLFITGKHIFLNMFKTCFSLHVSEIYYIFQDNNLPDYSFKKDLKDLFLRFLCPKISNKFIIFLTYYEIIIYFLILLGFIFFIFINIFLKKYFDLIFIILSFISLFIILSLSCGFARLRLPVEYFLIILSFSFWLSILKRKKSLNEVV